MEKSKNATDIILRNISTRKEFLNTFYRNSQIAGWEPCPTTNEVSMTDFQKNYYVGYKQDKPIFTFSLHTYDKERIAYFGQYFVLPEYRGKGKTFPMFIEKFNLVKKDYPRIYWTGVYAMEKKYNQALGGHTYGCMRFLTSTKESKIDSMTPKSKLVDLSFDNLSELCAYDHNIAGFDRSSILKKLMEVKEPIVGSLDSNGKIQGYGIIRPNQTGYTLGPLCAENSEICLDIMIGLLQKVSNGSKYCINMPIADYETQKEKEDKKRIFEVDLGMTLIEESAIQGTAPFPNNYHKTFLYFLGEHSF